MISVDTNVLVRLLTNDDPKQGAIAARLFSREDIHVSKTVLLETAWVLRSAYELSEGVIRDALERLVAAPSVTVEDPPAVARALGWYAAGMDFADALHLSSSVDSTRFSTFDKRLAKRTKTLAGAPLVTTPLMLLGAP